MHTHIKPLLISATILATAGLFVSGCASSATRSPEATKVDYRPSPATPLSAVAVEVTPAVNETLKDNFKFHADDFRKVIETALNSNQLLDPAKTEAPKLHIKVTKIRVRSTFNAVMWGAMAGNDSLTGEVTIVDSAGTVLDKLNVSASYALGGFAGGQDAMRMNWLYEAFVKEMVKVYREAKGIPDPAPQTAS